MYRCGGNAAFQPTVWAGSWGADEGHTHTHTHTGVHTHRGTHTHTQEHTHRGTHTHTQEHTHTHRGTYTQMLHLPFSNCPNGSLRPFSLAIAKAMAWCTQPMYHRNKENYRPNFFFRRIIWRWVTDPKKFCLGIIWIGNGN